MHIHIILGFEIVLTFLPDQTWFSLHSPAIVLYHFLYGFSYNIFKNNYYEEFFLLFLFMFHSFGSL